MYVGTTEKFFNNVCGDDGEVFTNVRGGDEEVFQ